MAASPQLQAVIDGLIPDPDAPVEAPTVEGIVELMEFIYPQADIPGITVSPVDVNGVSCEWLVHEDADPDLRMAYVHGGGYVAGSLNSHRTLCADLSRVTGVAILNIDYRLAPAHAGPAAYDDGMTAYAWMVENGPNGPGAARKGYIGGDSAGGGLALAMLMGARDAGLPAPSAGIMLSPWADMKCSSASFETNAPTDPMVQKGLLDWMATMVVTDGADMEDPRWSPVYGDYAGLPPLFVQAASEETLLGDSEMIARDGASAGVDVTFESVPGVIHVWHALGRDVPEAAAGIDRVGEWRQAHR